MAFSPIGPTPRNQSFLEQVRRNLTMHGALALAIKAAVAAGAAGVYYLRFRLPFALLLLAATLLTVALSLFSAAMPGSSNVVWSLVLFCGGAVVFAAAMAFDISDRERLTRRADCAFWLHLLAAPLIVHSLITLATGGITTSRAYSVAGPRNLLHGPRRW